MTSLSIYVEKWYIVGAVCTGNVPHSIVLPNGEDRIWLYFFEDTANNDIHYGLTFKRDAQNKENHFIDDVFSKIVQSGVTFKKFDRDFPLSEIFKYSNIFDDLKSAFAKWSSEVKVPVYISFSQDISFAAQSIFKTECEKNGFVIQQYAGKIDFLALEWIKRKKSLNLSSDKHALVLCSVNENLRMSLFKTDGSIFLEEGKDVLAGYGNDVRRHAVIEEVVNQGNRTSHFLTREEEIQHEKNRMEDFVEDWIAKLDRGKPGIPVKIPNICFSLAPNNSFTANLKRMAIDERTKAIIRSIVDYVKNFVRSHNISEFDFGAVILLGNSFGNSQYLNELDHWLQIPENRMFKINEASLPDVVGVYSQIDPGYFSTEEAFFTEQAGLEKERREKTEQEEAVRKAEEEAANQVRQTEAAKSQAEKKYKDAMDQAYEAESKHDYASMREFLGIALEAKPNNEAALRKLKALDDMEMQERLKNDQYRAAINQAEEALKAGDLETAFSFFSQALVIDPQSDHAKTKLEEVKKIRSDRRKAAEYLTKAEVFEEQGLFDKALTELRKAQLLDPDNGEISSRIAAIESSFQKKAEKIKSLARQISQAEAAEDYDTAVRACREILTEDEPNKNKWESKLMSLLSAKNQFETRTAVLAECKTKVMEAQFQDNWDDVLAYSKKALEIDPDDHFFLNFQQKARKELDKKVAPPKPAPASAPSGRSASPPKGRKPADDDDFFGGGPSTRPAARKPAAPSKPKKDDFFDS